MPEVSIIIPTYNRANFLPKTIQSVLNQTFPDFEVIVIDDGSTDNTKEIIEEIIKRDERVKYIYQENSGGSAKPRNRGIKISRGNYLSFLDSDDQWLPEKLEKQISFFKNYQDKNLGFLDCGILVVNENNSIIKEYKLIPSYRRNVFEKFFKNNFILTPGSVLLKKEVIEKVGLFDENFKLVNDWDLWLRISKNYNFDFIDEPLFKYCIHETNISKTARGEEIIKEITNFFEKHKKDYLRYLPNFYIENLRHFANCYCKSGQVKLGRKYFIKMIKANWRDCKSYFYYLLSFLGSDFYNLCFKIEKRLLRTKPAPQEEKFSDFREQIFERSPSDIFKNSL